MKRLWIVLFAALLLSACQTVAAPVSGSSVTEGTASPEASQERTSVSGEESVPSTISIDISSSAQEASQAQPVEPPAEVEGALKLPDTLSTSTRGYSVTLLAPAQYEMEAPLNRGGFRGFINTDIFLGTLDGKQVLFGPQGNVLSGPEYDITDDGWVAGNGAAFLKKDGKAGAVSVADGSVIVPFEYDYAWYVPGRPYLRVNSGEKIEIRTMEGAVKYTLERGDEFYVLGESIDMLVQGNMLKLMNAKDGSPLTNLACETAYLISRDDNADESGENLIAAKIGAEWVLLDENAGRLFACDELGGRFKGDYIDFTKDGKKGLLNYKGEVVLKPEWDDLLLYGSSASVCRGDKWGAVTDIDSGKLSIEPFYDFIGDFGESGLAPFEKDGKWGILDTDGNVQTAPKYSGMIDTNPRNFEEGVFLVDGDSGPGSAGILSEGKFLIPQDHFVWGPGINPVYAEEEPYNLVATPREKWGYVDSSGKLVIDMKYDIADGFLAGRDVAMVKQDGKICLIDRKGEVVLQTVFDDCGAINPDTMVCSMRYTDETGRSRHCLVKLNL